MSRPALFVVVSLSGAAVLVLEILGTRVLGPFYGVSLFLWSALIAVTLAALAAGYALGGRWASRFPSGSRLAMVLAAAGLWVLIVPWARGPLVSLASGMGLRPAVLLTASALFFPPLALLGMVGPYAIRLATRRVEEVGRVSGDLFAVSTLASVAAALLTGFVLIPELGVTRLLIAVGVLLLLASAFAAWAARAGARLLVLLALGAAAAAAGWVRAESRPAGLVARAESPYGELRVVDFQGLRYFLIDGGVHSVLRVENEFPRQAYVYAAELAADLVPGRGRLLLVGLGGGGTARVYSWRGWQVDAVEIDPWVPRLARRYFAFKDRHANVIVAEARRFLQTTPDRYDAVFLDAFGSSSIPFHLVTREAFAAAKARLAPGGVLALNVETVGWQDPLAHALFATLRTQFRNVEALPTSEPPDRLGNVVFLASDREMELTPEQLGDPVATLIDDDEHFRVVTRMHAWNNRYQPARGRVLTDDWNPSDLRAEEINLEARKALRALFPAGLRGE